MALEHTSKISVGPFTVLLKGERATISTFVHRPPSAYDDSETLEAILTPDEALTMAAELMSWAHRNGANIMMAS